MKTILSIESQDFLLPADANVNTLLKTLGACKKVQWDYNNSRGRDKKYIVESNPRIGVTIIQDSQLQEPKKPKQIPAQASPDANGKDFFRPEKP